VVEGQAEENKEGAPEQAEWLAKMREKNIHWVPWPNDDKIRTGNLMAIQHLLDQKRDPWTEAVPTKQELDDALKREKDAQEQAEAQARAQALAVREETARREPMVPTQAREPEQARPQFKGFEFDEDD
jgi:cell division septation protein DedD